MRVPVLHAPLGCRRAHAEPAQCCAGVNGACPSTSRGVPADRADPPAPPGCPKEQCVHEASASAVAAAAPQLLLLF